MAVSFFDRKLEVPTVEGFEESLSEQIFPLWKTLKGNIAAVYPKISYEWEYLSKRLGWFLICKSDEDTLLYVVPHENYFMINFIFDQDTFEAVQATNLPDPIMKKIKGAEQIDRGYSFFFDVRNVKDEETIEMLLQMQQEIKEQQD